MVYFIKGDSTKLTKIGQAKDIVTRLHTLQAASPDKLTVLAVMLDEDDDHPFHARFKSSWSHGEWFNLTPDLLAFIESLPESQYKGLSIQIGHICKGMGLSRIMNRQYTPREYGRRTAEAAKLTRSLVNLERYRQDPELLREAAILKANIAAARKSPAELRAEIEGILQTPPTLPMEILRRVLGQEIIRDGELETAHGILTGRDDDYVREIMLGEE